jgi:hypothetical protein
VALAIVLIIVALALPSHCQVIRCGECERDSHGEIRRSKARVRQFKRMKACPFTKEQGCVVDHAVPLACAGELGLSTADLDVTANMQWQTRADARAKDRWERKHCADLRHSPRFEPPQ